MHGAGAGKESNELEELGGGRQMWLGIVILIGTWGGFTMFQELC